jgi:DNA-binding LacI/PurR family transcriptional regulator
MAETLKQLAEQLNMSAATVSRCLSDHPDSDPDTRRKVKAFAAKVGYSKGRRGRPSGSRDASTKVRTKQIGVIARGHTSNPRTEGFVLEQLLEGLGAEARDQDASLLVHKAPPSEADNLHQPKCQPVALSKGELDGVVLIGALSPKFIRSVSEALPCVAVVERWPGVSMDCIDHDDADSVAQLVERFVAEGHRRIGFLSSPLTRSVYLARYSGLVQALLLRGLPCDPTDVINIYEHVDAATAARTMEARIREGVTAWVAAHDEIGYELMGALRDRGLSAPDDYSIAGFDRLPKYTTDLADMVSVQAPFVAMGSAAMQRLIRRINYPDERTQHALFQCKVSEGTSIGSPPDNVNHG